MNSLTFTARVPAPPEGMSLRGTLAWEYFFGRCMGG